ncbi:MAG: hypothetical protein WC750_00025 [Patescibacteria group bacterium]|jgi:hypothetical protein
MEQIFDKRTALIRTPAAGGAVFRKRKKIMKLSMSAFSLMMGTLLLIILHMTGNPLSSFERIMVMAGIAVVGLLAQISLDISKIAKSLEKNAETKSPQTSFEPRDK